MPRDALPTPTLPKEADADAESTELALWMGQLLMDQGAESERVEQSMRGCGESFGCDWSAVLVTYDALFVSRRAQVEARGSAPEQDSEVTVLRRARPRAVDMSVIEALSHLGHRIGERRLSRAEVRQELQRIESAPRHYSARLTGLAIAVACAAFSRLFQGDWGAFAATFIGSGGAMLVRHYYARRKPNRLIFAGASAFAAALLVGTLQHALSISQTPGAAYAACALMVVPGVPAINAVQDLIKGNLGVALARAVEAGLLILAGTLGILLGLGLSWGKL